jgi:hypothetical protein
MPSTSTFPLQELLRKALWTAHRHPDMGPETLPLHHASGELIESITRYHMQALFSAAFSTPYRSDLAPELTNRQVTEQLLDVLNRLHAQLHQRSICALPVGTSAVITYFRTAGNTMLLDGRIDLLVGAAYLPAVHHIMQHEGFTAQPADAYGRTLYTHGALRCCLHTTSAHFYCPSTRNRYRSLETGYRQSDSLCHQAIGDTRWESFPPVFLIIYITARIQQELIAGQPSLRTFCGWVMALHGERTALGIAEHNLYIRLRELHLHHLYRALGSAAADYLGLPRDSYACLSRISEREQQQGDRLWQYFVEQRIQKCRPGLAYRDGLTFIRKVKCWGELYRRCTHLRNLCGQEASFAPWVWLTCPAERR